MGLLINRYPGEAFTIGENIYVEVRQARGGKAELYIEAPKGMKITRVKNRHESIKCPLEQIPGNDFPKAQNQW